MTEADWKVVVSHVRSGRCVLFLGPGISEAYSKPAQDAAGQEAGDEPPTSLAEHLRRALVGADQLPLSRSPAALAQQCERSEDGLGGRSLLLDEVEAFARRVPSLPQQMVDEIAAWPIPLVITTFPDDQVEAAYRARGDKEALGWRYHFREEVVDRSRIPVSVSMDKPFVYHLQGWLQERESLILTERDVIDFLRLVAADNPSVPKQVLAWLRDRTRSVLFLGFGLAHPYLKFLLSHLRRDDRASRSFAFEGDTSVPVDNDTALFYRGDGIEFRSLPLPTFIGGLTERLSTAGVPMMVSTTRRMTGPSLFISYASENVDTAKRLLRDLEDAGFDVWLDKDGDRLPVGIDWHAEIQRRVRERQYFVVLVSVELERKLDSYVNYEIQAIKERAKRVRGSVDGKALSSVFPVRISPGRPIDDLQEFQELSLLPADYDAHLPVLVSTIRADAELRRQWRDR